MAPSSSIVNKEFSPIDTDTSVAMVQCNHCRHYRFPKGALARKKDHLLKCAPYKRVVGAAAELDLLKPRATVPAAFKSAPAAVKARRDRLLARAIYAGGLPLSIVDPAKHPEWSEFMRSFDGGWQPPTRERLGGSLLDEEYERVSDEVNNFLRGEIRLNLTADESTAGNSDRVANIAVNTTAGGSFHLHTMNLQDRNATAEEVAQMVIERAKQVTGDDLLRWNSICTDTCSTMRSMHNLLERNASTKHVFSVLCDSHGLQLLVKDILGLQGIEYYTSTLANAVFLSNTLRKSKLSLAIVRRTAEEQGLPFRAFATAAITRWGSHFAVLNALVESREALIRSRIDPRLFKSGSGFVTGGERALNLCTDYGFWERAEHLHSLLKAVNEAQLISESDRSTVGQIISRWDDLSEAIADSGIPFTTELCDRLDKRLDKQTTAIHWAARATDPALASASLDYKPEHEALARSFFMKHIPESRQQDFNHQFAQFRHQRGVFARSNSQLWAHAHDYITFWDIASVQATDLSELAVRLHETPANSVPSERSFSAMNFIQNDYRTRLSTIKTNKLTYIFMNTKALRRRPILESHHAERRRRRQERELVVATRKQMRQQELELLRAQGMSFGDAGIAVKSEQLHDDDLNELYDQAIAALPDYDASIYMPLPPPPPPIQMMQQEPIYYHTSFEGSCIDPIQIYPH